MVLFICSLLIVCLLFLHEEHGKTALPGNVTDKGRAVYTAAVILPQETAATVVNFKGQSSSSMLTRAERVLNKVMACASSRLSTLNPLGTMTAISATQTQ